MRDRRKHEPRCVARRSPPRFDRTLAEIPDRALEGHVEVKRGSMFGYPAFYVAGKLFACIYRDAIALKLPEGMVGELAGKPGFGRFRPMGRSMREWLAVAREPALEFPGNPALVLRALEFVGTLPAGRRAGRGKAP